MTVGVLLWLIELELKLRLIDYQENLIRNCAKDGSEEFLVPLSADRLIEVMSCLLILLLEFLVALVLYHWLF